MIAASVGVADNGMVVVVAVVVKINNRELKQRRRRRQQEREKSNRFRLIKQQLCPRIMLFCTFLCRRCTTTTWKCQISRFVEDENTRQQLSFSFPELWYSLLEFNSRKICQHLTNWMSWNKRDKVWGRANSLFKCRFGNRRRRRCCLSSLISYLSFLPTFNCNNKSMCHCRSISTYILPSIFYRGVSYVKSCVSCQYPCSSYRWFTVFARPFVFTIKAILRAVENDSFVLSDSFIGIDINS